MYKLIKLIPTILWGFFILILTLNPKSNSVSSLPLWLENLHPDKIAHFVFWAIWFVIYDLTVLSKESAIVNRSATNYNGLKAEYKAFYFILIASLVGAIVEILQWKLAWGRSAEWMDLLCDFLGLLFTYLLFRRSTSLK